MAKSGRDDTLGVSLSGVSGCVDDCVGVAGACCCWAASVETLCLPVGVVPALVLVVCWTPLPRGDSGSGLELRAVLTPYLSER